MGVSEDVTATVQFNAFTGRQTGQPACMVSGCLAVCQVALQLSVLVSTACLMKKLTHILTER